MKPLIYTTIGIACIVGIVFLVSRNSNAPIPTNWDSSTHDSTIGVYWTKVSSTTEITSDNVSVRWLKRTTVNPYSYEVYKVLATSTPNTSDLQGEGYGEYIIASTSPIFQELYQEENTNKYDGVNIIEIGCIDAKVECRAVLFNI